MKKSLAAIALAGAWLAIPAVAYAGSYTRGFDQNVYGTQTSPNFYVDGVYMSTNTDASGCGAGTYSFQAVRVRTGLPDAVVRSESSVGFCEAPRVWYNASTSRGNHHTDTRIIGGRSAGTGTNVVSWRN